MGLPHFEAKELACYYFMSADRIDETPGSESKDLLLMAEEAGWIWASWIQFLMARKPHVVMLWAQMDDCVHSGVGCLAAKEQAWGIYCFTASNKQAYFLS